MKFSKNIPIYIVAFTAGAAMLMSAKVAPRVAGLESDTVYMSLLGQEQLLKQKEDSVYHLVDQVRTAFRNNAEERTKSGNEILRLEGVLFEIRNDIGVLESKINMIEQEFVINNLTLGNNKESKTTVSSSGEVIVTPSKSSQNASANIVMNQFFLDNLDPRDLMALEQAQTREQSVVNYLKIYTSNHTQITRINKEYQASDNARSADSMHSKYRTLVALNNKIADSIDTIWGKIFDNKSYAYSYLFDKMNITDAINQFDINSVKMRRSRAELKEQVASDIVSIYPKAKALILDYELKMARALGLEAAADSLGKARRDIDTLNLMLPKIEIEERIFIDYADVTIAARTPYSTANPIPKCTIYPRGVVYRILLGSYTKAQMPSIFRGVSPISYTLGSDHKYNYYAGGYKTLTEAQTAADMLLGRGFRKADVVVWNNGQTTNISGDEQRAAKTGVLFRIEILSQESDLPQLIKEIIANNSEGIEISRVANNMANEPQYKFIVGTFNSSAVAEKLAQTVSVQDQGLIVSVKEIEK